MGDKVKVETLKYHTTAGEEYNVGDTYEVDEAAVEGLTTQGMAIRVDRVAHAKKTAAAAATKPAKAEKKVKKPRKAKK